MKHILLALFLITSTAHGAATRTTSGMMSTVKARYYTGAGNAVANNTVTFIDFGSKDHDSNNAVLGNGGGNKTVSGTGWRFVVPASESGLYAIAAAVSLDIGAGVVYNGQLMIYVNGSLVSVLQRADATSTSITSGSVFTVGGVDFIQLSAGAVVEIGYRQSNGGTTSKNMTANVNHNYVSIFKVSN